MNALVQSHRRSFAIILFSLFIHAMAWGQPAANFTATPQNGCSPLIVHFTDQSTGNPTQWRWDLGNGVISTLKNPSATYFNPGTYTIKLIVRNASGVDSIIKSQHITVYANPVVNFSASDTTGCFPLPIQFYDLGNAGSGTITAWHWDFGDGATSSQQNPVHTYQSAGNYNVTLKLTNSFGCIKTLTKQQYINITNGVVAGFNSSMPGVCTAPVSIQFNNTSTGPGNLSYSWDFGDGTSSTETNPSHNYTSNGNYTVTLYATSAQGCRDTLKMVNLLNIGTHHSAINSADTICIGQETVFNNASSPVPSSSIWYFSDGTVSDLFSPVKYFGSAGLYTVKLVNNFGSCLDSVTKQVLVTPKPLAAFDAGQKQFCKTPATVQFQSQAQGAVSYLWFFGDGSSSSAVNPFHIYTSNGNYNVTLIVTNASGCRDTLVRENFIQVQKPQIELTGLPKTGCLPLMVTPAANIISNQNIISYLWKFGDGATSTAVNPSHIYTQAGNYDITLVITTSGGCKDSVIMTNAVRTGNKPNAQFVAMPPVVCNINPVQFLDSSTGDIDEWQWSFGDSLNSGVQNPSHVFDNIGQFSVTLVVSSNTCKDTITKVNIVQVLPPISSFEVETDCDNKNIKKFVNFSVGATSWEWDFGDSTSSTELHPTHTYAAPGTYKVVLRVYNNNCWNINWLFVKVIDERIVLDPIPSTVCKGSPLTISATRVNSANITSWHWDFGDGNSSNSVSSATHTYSVSGVYQVVLAVTDHNDCITRDTVQVTVYGPKADFTTSAASACLDGNNIQFFNSSSSDGIHNIIKTVWSFGDGSFDSSGIAPYQHQYAGAGNYNIGLLVKDSYGCVDQLIKPAGVIISKPLAAFTASDTLSCTGKNISFNNGSTGEGLQYMWNFGDASEANSLQPVHSYVDVGLYTVKLLVTDQYGCQDSLVRNEYINISLPKARFAVSDSVGNCPPLIVNFINQSTGYTSLRWDFGDGNYSLLSNPVHFYNSPGTFYARLIVTGPGGCTDTSFQKIIVKGPSGSFSYSPVSGCNPLTVNFVATTQNASSFVWDFSDGNMITGSDSSISHIYNAPGEFIPKIILTDAAGCNYPVIGADTIRVADVTADFVMNANRFCEKGRVYFTNRTISNDLITGYQWNFGDGHSSNETNPSHHYAQEGSYTVQLIAFTQSGCRDTITLIDTVKILPTPSIIISSSHTGCVPAVFSFSGLNQASINPVTWQWNFDNGHTSALQNPAQQNYYVAGNYTVTAIATAINGCMDTVERHITVHPLPATNAGADSKICAGGSIQLNATGAVSYSWQSAPSLSCTNCPSPVATPVDSMMYVVTGTSNFGCVKKDSVIVSVQHPVELQVLPGDTICAGGSVTLAANGADIYSWSPSASVRNPSFANTIATPGVSTIFTVIGKDRYNCFADTASVFIKVWPIPTVNAGADQTLVIGDALQLNTTASTDVVSWAWNNAATLSCASCSTTLAKPKHTTTYTVQVKNGGGCSATDEVKVNVICNNGNLFVPNTFSPNADGVNDRFFPSGTGINRIRSLKVFNRWGEVVFERRDFSANESASGWDGTYKGQVLSPDVYIWSCEVICQNNEVLQFKGDVSLLR